MKLKGSEMKFKSSIGDTATVDVKGIPNPPSLRRGQISMLSLNGINVELPTGTKFIKWRNVKEIKKGELE